MHRSSLAAAAASGVSVLLSAALAPALRGGTPDRLRSAHAALLLAAAAGLAAGAATDSAAGGWAGAAAGGAGLLAGSAFGPAYVGALYPAPRTKGRVMGVLAVLTALPQLVDTLYGEVRVASRRAAWYGELRAVWRAALCGWWTRCLARCVLYGELHCVAGGHVVW
jgi:hypothetical protein